MTAAVIRIGANRAEKLQSGGWACTRPGDPIPVWRHDEQDAARLLRSWLPSIDVPPVDPCLCRGGRDVVDGRDLDGLDGAAPRALDSPAPGLVSTSPRNTDPGAPQTFRGRKGAEVPAFVASGISARAGAGENGAAA